MSGGTATTKRPNPTTAGTPAAKKQAQKWITLNLGEPLDPSRITLGLREEVNRSEVIRVLLDGQSNWNISLPWAYCMFGLQSLIEDKTEQLEKGKKKKPKEFKWEDFKDKDPLEIPWKDISFHFDLNFAKDKFEKFPSALPEIDQLLKNNQLLYDRIAELLGQDSTDKNVYDFSKYREGKVSFLDWYRNTWEMKTETSPPDNLKFEEMDETTSVKRSWYLREIKKSFSPLIVHKSGTSTRGTDWSSDQISLKTSHDKGMIKANIFHFLSKKQLSQKEFEKEQGFFILAQVTCPRLYLTNMGCSLKCYLQSANITPGQTQQGFGAPEHLTENQRATEDEFAKHFQQFNGGATEAPVLSEEAVHVYISEKSKGEYASLKEMQEHFRQSEGEVTKVLMSLSEQKIIRPRDPEGKEFELVTQQHHSSDNTTGEEQE